MTMYLRKAFKVGPVRLNVSKHGLGLSAGVRGARVGLTSDGRAYTHAGRFGLYDRSYYGHPGGKGKMGFAATEDPSGPVILEEDTGVTFGSPVQGGGSPTPTTSLTRKPPRVGPGPWLLFALGLLLFYQGLVAPGRTALAWLPAVVGIMALVSGIWLWIRAVTRRRCGDRFGRLLDDLVTQGVSRDGDRFARIRVLAGKPQLTRTDHQYFTQSAYYQALIRVVEDRRTDPDELAFLTRLEQAFAIDADIVRQARLDVFRTVYLEAVTDHELTPEEETTLTLVREGLGIVEQDIAEELHFLAELHALRAIGEGQLPSVECDVSLKQGETCHFQGKARILKSRIQRSFQRDGQRYKVRGLEVDKDGDFFVTDQRLLVIHSGAMSLPMSKILDVEVDWDRNLLSITRDGVQTPLLITTEDAPRAGMIIHQLSTMIAN